MATALCMSLEYISLVYSFMHMRIFYAVTMKICWGGREEVDAPVMCILLCSSRSHAKSKLRASRALLEQFLRGALLCKLSQLLAAFRKWFKE